MMTTGIYFFFGHTLLDDPATAPRIFVYRQDHPRPVVGDILDWGFIKQFGINIDNLGEATWVVESVTWSFSKDMGLHLKCIVGSL